MRKKELYIAISAQAKQVMPEFKYIDLDRGQENDEKSNYPVPLPFLLIEFGEFEYSNLLGGNQLASGDIMLKAHKSLLNDTYIGAPTSNAIDILDFEDEIFQKFQGFMGMSRTNSKINCVGNEVEINMTFHIEHREDYERKDIPVIVDFNINKQ
jgi:hypothetical protein